MDHDIEVVVPPSIHELDLGTLSFTQGASSRGFDMIKFRQMTTYQMVKSTSTDVGELQYQTCTSSEEIGIVEIKSSYLGCDKTYTLSSSD